jgi:predicted transcriptional regulator
MDGLNKGKRVSPDRLREVVVKRSDVLDAIVQEPMTKPELVERLAVSRSTVDRAISDLESVGSVTRTDSTYYPTTSGKLAFSEYRNYVEITEALAKGNRVLEAWPDDSPVSVTLVRDAEVRTANPYAPENALIPIIDSIEAASRIRVLMPVVLSTYLGMLETFVEENGHEADLVVEDEVLHSFDESYWSAVGGLKSADGVRVYTSERELPFALWLIGDGDDECAAVTVHEQGGIRGVLLNESEDAVGWATSHYEQYRSGARRLEP